MNQALTAGLSMQPGCGSLSLERQISRRDNSVVYLARLGDDGRRAAVKCCRVPGTARMDPLAAARQFEALRRVHEAFVRVPPQYGVPAPLCISLEQGAYAMAWIDGESLTDRLGGRAPAASVVEGMHAAGAWLASFHKVGPQHGGEADIDSKAAHVRAMASVPVQHPVFHRALAALTHSYPRVQVTNLRISWLHGDCKTDNFLLTPAGLYSIDIDLGHENAVEHDLAQFLNHVDLLAARWPYRHRRSQGPALQAAFLQGYQDGGGQFNSSVLHWLRLWGVATYWHTVVAEGLPAWPKRWLLNRLFSGVAASLLAATPPAA